jgi:hypothetical protein
MTPKNMSIQVPIVPDSPIIYYNYDLLYTNITVKGRNEMKRTLLIGVLLMVVLSACGGSAVESQAAGPEITVYKTPT